MEEDPFSISGIAADALLAWIASAAGTSLGTTPMLVTPGRRPDYLRASALRSHQSYRRAHQYCLQDHVPGASANSASGDTTLPRMRRDDSGRAIAGYPAAALSRVPSQNASRHVGGRAGACCR